jgi:hypothetical protein
MLEDLNARGRIEEEEEKTRRELLFQHGTSVMDHQAVLTQALVRLLPSHNCRSALPESLPPEEPDAGVGNRQPSPISAGRKGKRILNAEHAR